MFERLPGRRILLSDILKPEVNSFGVVRLAGRRRAGVTCLLVHCRARRN